MKRFEVRDRDPRLLAQLTAVWEDSVKATHHVLSPAEIEAIKPEVPLALRSVPHLIVAQEGTTPLAFLGCAGVRLEMLFVAAQARGRGIGRQLLQDGLERYALREVTVNEQNPQARGFYEHLGFRVDRRTALDEQDRPYPLLYMSLQRSPLQRGQKP